MALALLAPGPSIIYFALLLVSLAIPIVYRTATTQPPTPAASTMSDSTPPAQMPVYFLGIGGPNSMENAEHPAYKQLTAVGREITTKVKPKAIVVFSAHWQAYPNKIQINAAENTDIIYDFYGFPPHYYEYKFPNRGSPALAEMVIEKLAGVGIEVERVKRGLDHGVWAGFIVGRPQIQRILLGPSC